MNVTVLVCALEPGVGGRLRELFGPESVVEEARDADAALKRIDRGPVDLVVADDILGRLTGEEVAERARAVDPDVAVVVASTHARIATAVQASEGCDVDYVEKPVTAFTLRHAALRALERSRLARECRDLRARVGRAELDDLLVGPSRAVRNLHERIRFAAVSAAPVLVVGEDGSGIEAVAEMIRRDGPGADRPVARLYCGENPPETLADELFGGEPRTGVASKLDVARDGTILLHEVGALDAGLQARLAARLAAQLQGRPEPGQKGTSIRVIATCTVDPRRLVREGRLREDLYYALDVLRVDVPPLRERVDDIAALAARFAAAAGARAGRPPLTFTPAALDLLRRRRWPGNLRELQETIERLVAAHGDGLVDASDLGDDDGVAPATASEADGTFRSGTIRAMERLMILYRLEAMGRNRTRTAESLDISVRTLRNKLHEYGAMGLAGPRDGARR